MFTLYVSHDKYDTYKVVKNIRKDYKLGQRQIYKGFLNSGNSCYADSVLFPLLYYPSSYTHRSLMSSDMDKTFRHFLNDAYVNMYKGKRMGPLYKKIEHMLKILPGDQFDACEVLNILDKLGIFLIKYEVAELICGTDQNIILSKKIKTWESNCIRFPIKPGMELINIENGKLGGCVVERDISEVNREINGEAASYCIEYVRTIVEAKAIILAPHRSRYESGRLAFNDCELKIVEFIEIHGRLYFLFSTVCYISNHYFTVFKHAGQYYLYDDLRHIKRLTREDAMSVTSKYGILYLYFDYRDTF